MNRSVCLGAHALPGRRRPRSCRRHRRNTLLDELQDAAIDLLRHLVMRAVPRIQLDNLQAAAGGSSQRVLSVGREAAPLIACPPSTANWGLRLHPSVLNK